DRGWESEASLPAGSPATRPAEARTGERYGHSRPAADPAGSPAAHSGLERYASGSPPEVCSYCRAQFDRGPCAKSWRGLPTRPGPNLGRNEGRESFSTIPSMTSLFRGCGWPVEGGFKLRGTILRCLLSSWTSTAVEAIPRERPCAPGENADASGSREV